MSYCRWGVDGSNVYVFITDEGYICCECKLRDWGDALCQSPESMITHLKDHEKEGDTVPAYVFEQLKGDSLTTDVINIRHYHYEFKCSTCWKIHNVTSEFLHFAHCLYYDSSKLKLPCGCHMLVSEIVRTVNDTLQESKNLQGVLK